jgi:hypothetical protein
MTDFLVISDFNVQNPVAIPNNVGAAEGPRAVNSPYRRIMHTLPRSRRQHLGLS